MKVFDGHIHILPDTEVNCSEFYRKLDLAGVDGGVVISLPPAGFDVARGSLNTKERLDNLFCWVEGHPNLYPFYWIDPLEEDAGEQVQTAIQRGARGFKVICNNFFPGEERALDVYATVAKAGKPILFHSGILWDGRPSSRYNRPAEFEVLLDIEGLRFALAHISWPWCDECIAVFGKLVNARTQGSGSSSEMFIDIAPGTPPIYRKDALTKLFTVGYDLARNVIFGTDAVTNQYDETWAQEWIRRDNEIYATLGLDEATRQAIYADNLHRFIGVGSV